MGLTQTNLLKEDKLVISFAVAESQDKTKLATDNKNTVRVISEFIL